ncbi:hypothetical protein TKK_0000744 [Trichogramma kaykai]
MSHNETRGRLEQVLDTCCYGKFHYDDDDDDDDFAATFFKINDELNRLVQVNVRDNSGNTPLHLSLHYMRQKTSELLLRKGADPNAANEDGLTPLHVVCQRPVRKGMVKMIFEISNEQHQTVNIDAQDKSGH